MDRLRCRHHLMAGALMALAGAGGASGGTGVVITPTPVWRAIYDSDAGSTNSPAILGITTAISISLARTGLGVLYYNLNNGFAAYSGAFTVRAGDTLAFTIIASGSVTVTGNITVTNVSNASATVATIPYTVTSTGHL